jgi:hypothetical protein
MLVRAFAIAMPNLRLRWFFLAPIIMKLIPNGTEPCCV